MNYISIREAAERWGITERRVQELCRTGSITDAQRLGRAWMIPEHTEKPLDRRTRTARTASPDKMTLILPKYNPFLIHTTFYHSPGTADQCIAALSNDPTLQEIVKAQFTYLRGGIDDAGTYADTLLQGSLSFGLRLPAISLLSMHALWNGDLYTWNTANRLLRETECETEIERYLLDLRLAADASAIYDNTKFPDWFRSGFFDKLPLEYFSCMRGFYVKHLFINAYELACGRFTLPDVQGLALMRTLPYIIEPQLAQARIEKTLLPEVYMLLIAATVYHCLGEKGRATLHLDRAISLTLPDRLYIPLVEYRSGLDTLFDERLSQFDSAALKRIRELHRRMRDGRIRLHNQVTGRTVTPLLTVREREIAKLAVFGVSNAEIAKRLNIELHSVKHYIYSAMNKVGVNKRAELGMFV